MIRCPTYAEFALCCISLFCPVDLTRCTHSTDTAAGQAKSVSSDVESRAKAALNPYKAWLRDPAVALILSFPAVRVSQQHPQVKDGEEDTEMQMDTPQVSGCTN